MSGSEWRGRQCASIVREEMGEWVSEGGDSASIVREEVGKWVSEGGDNVRA